MPLFNDMFTTLLPHGNDKILKQAFYNVIAAVFVALAATAGIAVYFVLQPFLRPLLWAVLFGSVLHPFKRQLTNVSKQWLQEAQTDHKPLVVTTIILPFNVINWFLNELVSIVKQYAKLLLFIFVALLFTHLCIYYFTFTHWIIIYTKNVVLTSINFVSYLQNLLNVWIVSTLAAVHFLTLIFWWTDDTRSYIVFLSPFVWLALIGALAQSMGTIGICVAIIMIILALAGLVRSLFASSDSSNTNDEVDISVKRISSNVLSVVCFLWNTLKSLLPSHPTQEMLLETPSEERNLVDTIDTSEERVTSTSGDPTHLSTALQANEDRLSVNSLASSSSHQNLSNAILYALLWSCLLAQIWLRPQIIYLLLVPLLLLIFKWFFERLQNSEFIKTQLNFLKAFGESRKEALFHPIIRTFYQYLIIGDGMICESLQRSLDSICSLVVIFMMVICVLFATIFLSVQIYHESSHLMILTGNLVNSTVVNNPELSQLFPGNFIEKTMIDEMIGNAYHYGRNWIKNNVYIIGDENSANASRAVEKQILEVWDRAYHLWLNRSENLTRDEFARKLMRSNSFEAYQWDKLFTALKSLNFALCFNVLKENLDIIISVFDSVWSLLKGNINLLLTVTTAILTLLFNGSSAILNAFLSLIVFSTSLFYLLCSSGEQYKPIELANRSLPIFSEGKSKNKLGQTVEEAVNSVFAASFKMMAFYGLYTWLTHTLFEVQIIFIPSDFQYGLVFAAVLGAVPFIGAYWASLPAVLELWLVNGSGTKSILMALLAMLPSYFVDSSIYSDIKGGGHPYLTGLAIAGGVFYLGFEGALFGPMLLCCFFVVAKMYSTIMSETPLEPDTIIAANTRPTLKRQQTMT
ncbi:transmembrane protein 245-like protein [Dinothrombium tinctorium]|uniref:Transmembrane protein 245-like protein n=1 Tax=Dinothrombium tinctorium TaxID=1965070 RepID=A0A443QN37_9ACAR|nr:transmembrane protein 245-like protein [Dinothrombium tinctorium]RWS11892.1 transmembrane protein 245-like protein [Dinothrombium tinctorium]